MSTIKCPECGQIMSDTATTCPECGCPVHHINVPPEVPTTMPKEECGGSKIYVILGIITLISGGILTMLSLVSFIWAIVDGYLSPLGYISSFFNFIFTPLLWGAVGIILLHIHKSQRRHS